MGSFTASLQLNIERVHREIDTKCFAIFSELAQRVVYRCPVLRGNLINDFWPASNAYNTTSHTLIDSEGQSQITGNTDVTGAGSVSRIRDVQGLKTFYKENGFLSFSTSVPYAHRIEYEGWSARKAPSGFIRNSLAEVAAKHK